MDKDEHAKGTAGLKIVSLAGRIKRYSVRDWVQAIPGLPTEDVLQETTIILGCITGLTYQALSQPKDAQTLMRATYYLSGMAKAMIDGQLPVKREQGDS
ncbi:DUF3077 domain-containing protein [Pseudomonas sp. BW13M1]|uniref:DUF3077 domain-containing protein n=1 Tax=Pseudomonas peradeniyensis TaxID=2745488 RepID=A0A923G756_9PSED|nr:DUF3077 domain-containing protein [Pseudomonas peradeniyensis]MBV4504057.1 DUF3077 domain-containing protein [Pseudomonas peradeniyensis]